MLTRSNGTNCPLRDKYNRNPANSVSTNTYSVNKQTTNFIFFSNRRGGKIVLKNNKKSTSQVKGDKRGRERVCATGREASSTPVESSLGLLANRATALKMHSMQTKYLLGDQRY